MDNTVCFQNTLAMFSVSLYKWLPVCAHTSYSEKCGSIYLWRGVYMVVVVVVSMRFLVFILRFYLTMWKIATVLHGNNMHVFMNWAVNITCQTWPQGGSPLNQKNTGYLKAFTRVILHNGGSMRTHYLHYSHTTRTDATTTDGINLHPR